MEDTKDIQTPVDRRPFEPIVLRFLLWLCSRGRHKWEYKTIKGGTWGLIYSERTCERCKLEQEHFRLGGWHDKGTRILRGEFEAEDKLTGVEVDSHWRPIHGPVPSSRTSVPD